MSEIDEFDREAAKARCREILGTPNMNGIADETLRAIVRLRAASLAAAVEWVSVSDRSLVVCGATLPGGRRLRVERERDWFIPFVDAIGIKSAFASVAWCRTENEARRACERVAGVAAAP